MGNEVVVPVSALQHWVYCPRQCALIYIEDIWHDNIFTIEGTIGHEHVDELIKGVRRGVRYETAVPIWSDELHLIGRCDLVEFRPTPYPVEHKRGSRKAPHADATQLCAQALCLEEMLGQHIPVGAVYHRKTRTREEVEFTEELREFTRNVIAQIYNLLMQQEIPPPPADRRCRNCSLLPACLPYIISDDKALQKHQQLAFHPQID